MLSLSLLPLHLVFTSWLTKEGGGHKSWKKRYFRLTAEFTLTYAKTQKVSPHSFPT